MLKILRRVLIQEGYNVVTAQDGKEGITAIFAQRPDLILLDIMMPVMGGITVLKKLQGDAWARLIPIMIITNVNDLDLVMEALEFGPMVAPSARPRLRHDTASKDEIRTFLQERLSCGVYEFIVKKNLSLKELVEKVRGRVARVT